MTSKVFITESATEWIELGGGMRRQIMAYDPNIMIVKVAFESGAIGAVHAHPHTQGCFVVSGVFEITVADQSQTLKAGDSFYAAPDVPHGLKCIEAGVLIDTFSPMRQDFIK